jgi:guanylate kinase
MAKQTGNLFVITGPSGVGKGTLCKRLLEANPDLHLSISTTSRSPRPHETDGVDYHFVDRETFEQYIAAGQFLEWAEYNGNYYGTRQEAVREALVQGRHVLLEIDTQGALAVKEQFPQACLIFIEPPSMEELRHRLHGRGVNSEEEIEARLAISLEELAKKPQFDQILINDQLESCFGELQTLIDICRKKPVS